MTDENYGSRPNDDEVLTPQQRVQMQPSPDNTLSEPQSEPTKEENVELISIEARIQELTQKLKEIANSFGIDSEQFGDDDDQSIIDKITRLSSHPSALAVNGEFLFDRFDYFNSIRNKKSRYMGPESSTRSLFQTRTTFEKTGSMQLIEGNSFRDINPPFFTQQECNTASEIPDTEIMLTIGQQIIIEHLKRSPDQEIQNFLRFIQNRTYSDELPLTNNLYQYVTKNNIDQDEAKKLQSKIIACRDNIIFPDSYQRLRTDLGRLQMHLCILTVQRYWYFDSMARSGQLDTIKDNSTENRVTNRIFSVDDSFLLTEEMIKSAKEADLPWAEIQRDEQIIQVE